MGSRAGGTGDTAADRVTHVNVHACTIEEGICVPHPEYPIG